MLTDVLGFFDGSRSITVRGAGYFAGEAPDPGDPESPDGRFRKLNVPAVGRVVVFERGSMLPVADTLSALDGTWRIDWLDPARKFVVIGFDGSGAVNAAIQDFVSPEPYA
jgi:hypothetical protein